MDPALYAGTNHLLKKKGFFRLRHPLAKQTAYMKSEGWGRFWIFYSFYKKITGRNAISIFSVPVPRIEKIDTEINKYDYHLKLFICIIFLHFKFSFQTHSFPIQSIILLVKVTGIWTYLYKIKQSS